MGIENNLLEFEFCRNYILVPTVTLGGKDWQVFHPDAKLSKCSVCGGGLAADGYLLVQTGAHRGKKRVSHRVHARCAAFFEEKDARHNYV